MKNPALSSADLITRSSEPPNLEMPFSSLREFTTPNESFYVRCHFPVPEVEAENFRLVVEGAVAKRVALSLAELEALPQHEITATMECAGNGRSHLQPRVKGVAWDIGAVGNAKWSGVWLREVLALAGVAADATEVVLEGLDRGTIKEAPCPPGEIPYARSLPLAKAHGDVLLSLRMNGEKLSASHGFPVRAVVSGWYGMASVKWLHRLVLSRTPFQGYYQTIDYAYWTRQEGLHELRPIQEMEVKAQIARPAPEEVLSPNESYLVHGAAWSGETGVVQVEFSADGGRSWAKARLRGEAVPYAWRFWEYEWQTPSAAGRHTLMARATDGAGRTQPAERVREYGTYVINHWLAIEVEIR